MTAAPALELRSITKSFGSVSALGGAELTAAAGSLHMLLGENGAGKTTLLRIAAGFAKPDAGEVLLRGVATRWSSRAQAMRAGVAVVEQHFSLVPEMTVAENVALASGRPFARYSPSEAASCVEQIARSAGLRVDPNARVSTLGVAAQQRAEIVKALSTNAWLLILDEPTSVLSPPESAELFSWLGDFVATGRTAIVITHRIQEARQHGDALTVLREGRTVLRAMKDSVSRDDLVAAIMGGRIPPAINPASGDRTDSHEVVASLQGVSVQHEDHVAALRDVTIEVRRGEIVGVAGIEGSGQRELLRVLAGRLTPTSGTISTPERCAFIPEDRLHDALIGEMTLVENFAIQGLGSRAGTLDWDAVAQETRRAMKAFVVRAHDEHQLAGTLSGGNQQKFVLARELAAHPPLIVAENPTRGLDVRASADVMERLASARNAGAGVVLYSSDIEDLVGFVDRVVVCYSGSVRDVPGDLTAVGRAMLGVK